MTADIPEEAVEEKPDFSTMTKEEIFTYQQSQFDKLQNESLSDRAKRDICVAIDETERHIKQGWNNAVDTVYDGANSVYQKVADGVKLFFNRLRLE